MIHRLIARVLVSTPLVLGSLLPPSAAGTAQEVEEDSSLATALVTPHEPWGNGWARGPVRTLYFVYTGAYDGTWEDELTRVREVVELQERFDVPGDAVLFCGSGENWVFHGLRDGETRAERLLETPYDLYVIGGFPFERLPAKMQYEVIRQVARGAGLLCCGPPAAEFMAERRHVVPTPTALVGGLPELDGKPADQYVTAYEMGKGRGVWLNYQAHAIAPYHEFSWRALTEYDYWMALIGRAALWAAGRDTGIEVDPAAGGKPMTLRREAPVNTADVSVTSNAYVAASLTVGTSLRRLDDGARTDLPDQQVFAQPGRTVSLKARIPPVRAGDYCLNAVVREGKGVVAFGAGNVAVTSEAGIESVEVDRPFVECGDPIRITAVLRGTPPPGSILRVRLRDSYDRVVRQRDYPIRDGLTSFGLEYRADAFATILMRAEALLIARGQEVEMKTASFTVPKRRQGQFNFVMWDAPRDVLGLYTWRQLQEAGMGVCLLGAFGKSEMPAALLAADASLAPYSTRILDPKDERGWMQPVCWNDEPAVDQYVQGIVDNQALLRQQGVFTYSLGDEGVTKGCCVSPSCLAAYRRWLEGQYGSIDRLNTSWDSTYASFDQVDLLNPKDNMEEESRKSCFPRWYDREAFARYNLMQLSKRFVDAYRLLDPESHCGFEGTGGFGDDYDAILGINTFYGPYPSIGDDIIRSAYDRDRIRSNWMGYSKTGDALSDAAWRMVMKGMDSIWYWMWSGIGSWRGYVRPTLDFWPATEDLRTEMQPVREGLGDLLLQSKMLHSGIAVFYSLPSALSGQLETSGAFATPESAHVNWLNITYELGLDVKYLTSGMLKRGDLKSDEFKVLLLPMAQALSPEEARLIREFADRGGTVIADVRPGVYDEHCKPLLPGALDDFFGIRRIGRGTVAEGAVELRGDLDGQAVDVSIPHARADADVRADTAQALGTAGESPLLLARRVGSGRAVLLNCEPIIGRSTDPDGAGARALLKALYDWAGVRPAVAATARDGGSLPGTETRIWADGDALVLGLWRRMENAWFSPTSGTSGGEPQPVHLTLRQPLHVYDLRARKYLGRLTSFDADLRWGRASFFMLSPREIRGLSVRLSSRAPDAGRPFYASVALDVPASAKERLAVWLQVMDPEGNSPLWGRQVVILEDGKARVPLLVAHNDRPGTWRVRVTELFTKATAEATWVVRKSDPR